MDCSPPGSSVHGSFQARILEWGAIAFSVYWHKEGEKKSSGHNRESRRRLVHTHSLDLGYRSFHIAMAKASLLNKAGQLDIHIEKE